MGHPPQRNGALARFKPKTMKSHWWFVWQDSHQIRLTHGVWSPGLKHKHCCWQSTCLTHAPGCTLQNMHPSGGSLMGDGQKTNFRSYTDGALMGPVGTVQWCPSTISKYWTSKYWFWDVTSKQPQVQTHLGELAHVGFNQLQHAVCQPNQWSMICNWSKSTKAFDSRNLKPVQLGWGLHLVCIGLGKDGQRPLKVLGYLQSQCAVRMCHCVTELSCRCERNCNHMLGALGKLANKLFQNWPVEGWRLWCKVPHQHWDKYNKVPTFWTKDIQEQEQELSTTVAHSGAGADKNCPGFNGH